MTLENVARVYPDYKQKCAGPGSLPYKHPSNDYCCNFHTSGTNGLSTSILKIFVFPEPIDLLKKLSRFPPSNDYSSSSTDKILWKVEAGEK